MDTQQVKYKNDMFKIHSGAHPLSERNKQVDASRVSASCAPRHRSHWTDEELLSVIITLPPHTTDEIATALGREPGAISLVKKFARDAVLRPEMYLVPEWRNPRLGIRWRIADVLLGLGIQSLSDEEKAIFTQKLPGTVDRKARSGEYLAKNT